MTLQQYLEDTNKTIADLSKESGLPYSTISELVNGKKTIMNCTVETVYQLANSLSLTVDELLKMEKDDKYKDKYLLTEKEELFLAKKFWDENVYCGMRMENRAVTFPQTKTIIEGINVSEVSLDDVFAIRNMRDAWKYIFSTAYEPLSLDYICKLNSYIARDEALEWGVLRSGNVGISGTSYIPPIPKTNAVERELNNILLSFSSITEKALDIFCFITRNQLFWDGNKRTSLCAANKLLLSKGRGLLTIKEKNMKEFNTLLCSFYDTGDKEELKSFLYHNAIFGIGRSEQ